MATDTARPDAPLTMAQATAELGISASTLRRWTSSGYITCLFTLGGQRRYPRSEVDRVRDQIASGERPEPHTVKSAS